MIFKKEKEIVAVFRENKAITAIYRGSRLVWQAIRSCFGAGFWINEKPWINEESWRNK
ncbi:MFS transporter [Bacteroides sp.]|uniref:MFS transporter n=1 Tax=Bacteroides sp. TaxID=29523 RepID=UPI002A837813|nr:MFS transporter [Bacteroides sp.]